MQLEQLQQLAQPGKRKVLMLIMDGLGGLGNGEHGPTELETAATPNLDRLARQGICGLHNPVGIGITPGSGPGHLALFGYDPLQYKVGRGVLSALGIGFGLQANDVAARGNFCTIDAAGKIADRRAGRISSARGQELCQLLRTITLPGIEVFVEPVQEHRFLLVLRGKDLSAALNDTDPQQTGQAPLRATGKTTAAEATAELVEKFVAQAAAQLQSQSPANMV